MTTTIKERRRRDITCDMPLRISEKMGVLTQEEEYALADKIQAAQTEEERIEHRNKLVMHNLRAAVRVARQYARGAVTMDDTLTACYMGMIRAAEKFTRESANGGRFINYATWFMRAEGQIVQRHRDSVITLPHHPSNQMHRVRDAVEEHGNDDAVIAALMEGGLGRGRANGALDAYRATINTLSLDRDDDGLVLHGSVMDPNAWTPEDSHRTMDLEDLIGYANDCLSGLHYAALMLRYFGSKAGELMTLAEIGERINRTRERSRQLIEEAEDMLVRYIRRCERFQVNKPTPSQYDPERVEAAIAASPNRYLGRGVKLYCPICGTRFRARVSGQRYCRTACAEEASAMKRRKYARDVYELKKKQGF